MSTCNSAPFDEASLPPAVQEYIRDSRERFYSLVRQRDAAEARAAELVLALIDAEDAIQSVVHDDQAIESGLFQGPLYKRIIAKLQAIIAKQPTPTDEQQRAYFKTSTGEARP